MKAPASLDASLDEAGFERLDIAFAHGERAGALPPLHNDFFDRMLIAQATLEELTLVTADEQFAAYGVQLVSALA